MLDAVGAYRIGELLGRGGQGEVWRATAPDGSAVALKLLRPELSSDAEVAGRFKREIRLSLALDHMHVLRGIDGGEWQGRFFLVSELADGGSLQQRLRGGTRLPVAEALDLLLAVLSGLDAIHRAGLVHRDVKPANLLFAGGVAKLSDLGLARAVSREHSCYSTSGALIGTPAYISPEMVLGSVTGIRSDLYAAGCLLYACLCGRPPFQGRSQVETLRQHLDLPVPDPRQQRDELGDEVVGLVRRLLAKRPEDRPADPAAAHAEALAVRATCLESRPPSVAGDVGEPADSTVTGIPPPVAARQAARKPFPLPQPAGSATLFPATLADGGLAMAAPATAAPQPYLPTIVEGAAVIPATIADAGVQAVPVFPEGLVAPPRAFLRHPAGLLVAYAGTSLVFGRDAVTDGGNDVCLRLPADPAASKRLSSRHLSLRLRQGCIEAMDLGSSGGSRCAGCGLAAETWTALADGAVLELAGALALRLRLIPGGGEDRAVLIDRPRDRSGHAYLLVPVSAGLGFGAAGPGPGNDALVVVRDGGLWLIPRGCGPLPWGPGISLTFASGAGSTMAFDAGSFKL